MSEAKKLFLVVCNEHNDLLIYAIRGIDAMDARKTCPSPGTIVTVNEVGSDDIQVVCHLQELRHRLV